MPMDEVRAKEKELSEPVCLCVHWFPRLEDRERCPFHSSTVRLKGHDYFDGGTCTWQQKPVWPSQKPWVDGLFGGKQ